MAGTLSQYTGATARTDRNFTINAGQTATFDVSNSGANLTISGASTATSGSLTKLGAGTLTLTGANLYTGATQVGAGTLTAGAANALGSTTSIAVGTGGTLLLSGNTTTDRINNSASVNLAAGSAFMTAV